MADLLGDFCRTHEDIVCGLDRNKSFNKHFLQADVKSLLEIVYTGSIEATMEEMRRMLILAHSLYISVPVIIMMMMVMTMMMMLTVTMMMMMMVMMMMMSMVMMMMTVVMVAI